MSIFGNRLKELRESAGKMQAEVAEMLGKTSPAISKYESGDREPNISEIKKLANYFGTTTDYLFGQTNVKYSIGNIATNVMHIMNGLTVEGFVKDVERKTGTSIKSSDIEACINGLAALPNDVMNTLASYANVDPSSFLIHTDKPIANVYPCSEMEELEKYKESPLFRDILQLALKMLENNVEASHVEKILDVIIQVKNNASDEGKKEK